MGSSLLWRKSSGRSSSLCCTSMHTAVHNGSLFRVAVDLGLIEGPGLVQVGLRGQGQDAEGLRWMQGHRPAKTSRIELRATVDDRELLDRAAAALGTDRSSFLLSAAAPHACLSSLRAINQLLWPPTPGAWRAWASRSCPSGCAEAPAANPSPSPCWPAWESMNAMKARASLRPYCWM
jgi:hypothetical protein